MTLMLDNEAQYKKLSWRREVLTREDKLEKSALGRFTELKRDKFLLLNRVFYNNYMCMFLL